MTERADEARLFASGNVLVVTDISKADKHLAITCIVWEVAGRSSYSSKNFTLHIEEEKKSKSFVPCVQNLSKLYA